MADADRVIEMLWRPGDGSDEVTVYALLDGARDPRIYDLVRLSKLDYRCLFLGKLAPQLARAAPYLVMLGRKSALTRQVIEEGWGESWGIFVRSPAILQDLRRHFRQFLQVEDETGKKFFFRFWDPRVLRMYLPTCIPIELRALFGPVERYCMEGEDPGELLEFELDDLELKQQAVPLTPAPPAPPAPASAIRR